ncbi:MAG TPA: hypothetical protein VG369_08120, partial [Humibacter sp.]|nr:hypothetical protein [Humibacter sp.]
MAPSLNRRRGNVPGPRRGSTEAQRAASDAMARASVPAETATTRPRRVRGRELHSIARHGRLQRKPWTTFGKVVACVASVAVASVVGIGGVAAVNLVSDAKPSVHLVGHNGVESIPDIGAIDGGV